MAGDATKLYSGFLWVMGLWGFQFSILCSKFPQRIDFPFIIRKMQSEKIQILIKKQAYSYTKCYWRSLWVVRITMIFFLFHSFHVYLKVIQTCINFRMKSNLQNLPTPHSFFPFFFLRKPQF